VTVWPEQQHAPITWEMFLVIDEDIRRELEIVDGYVIPRDPADQSRTHTSGPHTATWERSRST
jgi:hypothetical protein